MKAAATRICAQTRNPPLVINLEPKAHSAIIFASTCRGKRKHRNTGVPGFWYMVGHRGQQRNESYYWYCCSLPLKGHFFVSTRDKTRKISKKRAVAYNISNYSPHNRPSIEILLSVTETRLGILSTSPPIPYGTQGKKHILSARLL